MIFVFEVKIRSIHLPRFRLLPTNRLFSFEVKIFCLPIFFVFLKKYFVPCICFFISSRRCKLFYKLDAEWRERGVGNLFIKPTTSEKFQLLIRADTNLGKLLLQPLYLLRTMTLDLYHFSWFSRPLSEAESSRFSNPHWLRLFSFLLQLIAQ